MYVVSYSPTPDPVGWVEVGGRRVLASLADDTRDHMNLPYRLLLLSLLAVDHSLGADQPKKPYIPSTRCMDRQTILGNGRNMQRSVHLSTTIVRVYTVLLGSTTPGIFTALRLVHAPCADQTSRARH